MEPPPPSPPLSSVTIGSQLWYHKNCYLRFARLSLVLQVYVYVCMLGCVVVCVVVCVAVCVAVRCSDLQGCASFC